MTSSGHDHHGDHTHGNHLIRPAAVIGHGALSDPERIVGNPTGPTPSSTAPRPAPPSTCGPPSRTWSATTAARSVAWP